VRRWRPHGRSGSRSRQSTGDLNGVNVALLMSSRTPSNRKCDALASIRAVGTDSLDEIRDRLTETFRSYVSLEKGPERAIAVKKAAALLADARELFYTRDGEPDLLGRSYEYRVFVGEAMDDARIPKSDRSSLMAAVRFHISPILHERHGGELAARGLDGGSIRDRARQRRQEDAAIIRFFGGGAPIKDADEVIRLADLVVGAFSRVHAVTGDLGAASDAVTRAVKELADAQKRITQELVRQPRR